MALIALVGLLAYANTFHVPFVFDDEGSILENPVIKDLGTFFSEAGYGYNPRRFIGYLSIALNYRLGGAEVTGYHVVNLSIHLASAWLVYCLIRLTLATPYFSAAPAVFCTAGSAPQPVGKNDLTLRWVPLFAALLFVAHPVQTQAVTYIIQRLASLAAMLYLAALVCYLKARLCQESTGVMCNARIAFFYVLALLAALLAMKTKEIAFTLPFVLVLQELSFFGVTNRKKLLFLLPILLTIVIVPLGLMHAGKPVGELLSDVSKMSRETTTISRGDYLVTQFSVVVTYLRLLIFPVGQNLDYDYPLYHSLFVPRVFCSFLLLLVLMAASPWLYYRSRAGAPKDRLDGIAPDRSTGRLIGFGIAWFFITLSVESSIIPIRDVIFEHRLYLPSVGAFAAIGALGAQAARRFPAPKCAACAAGVIIVLAVMTWQRNLVWGSAAGIWGDCVAKSPDKVRPHNNLANALTGEGRMDQAIEQLQLILAVQPDEGSALRNLGAAYEKKGLTGMAIEQYRASLRSMPNDADTRYNLGVALAKMGDADAAIVQFQFALKLNPNYAPAYNNLGVAYGNKGEFDQAIEQFRSALRLDPGLADAHGNLGRALGKQGKLAQAEEEYRVALVLRPEDPDAYNSLGQLSELRGDAEQAALNFQKAAALQPDNPTYSNNLYRVKLNRSGSGPTR